MKKTFSARAVQFLLVLLGTAVCALGIQLELFSGAGVDPLTMFEEGLGRTLGTATGNITLGVNCVMLALAFSINRRRIWVGTAITALLLGPFINLSAMAMDAMGLLPPAGWAGKLIFNVAGVLLCGVGIAVYLLPDFGVGAMEVVMIFLSEKLHLPYGPVRVGMDCTWGVLGFFLGGTLGVGTIIGAFGIGTSMDLCLRWLQKYFGEKVPRGK